jgi:hypothetical protein
VETAVPLASAFAGNGAIKYVFFIVKENRTYDQVLGDLGEGNGDPALTLFGNAVTPIQHYLANSFLDFDNLFVDGEVSTTGHSVTSSGYASPYLQMLTSLDYSGRLDGSSEVAPGGYARTYLWDVLKSAKISYRVFGEAEYFQDFEKIVAQYFGQESQFAQKLGYLTFPDERLSGVSTQLGTLFAGHLQQAGGASSLQALLANPQFGRPFSKILVGDNSLYTAMQNSPGFIAAVAEFFAHWQFGYPTFNLNISDLTRISAWLPDFQSRIAQGRVDAFNYLILPNDHTAGSGAPITPSQYVAQNDAALDIFLRALSQSAIWQQSLVLVVEDDAQDGLDHVDATRTTAFAISPWVRRNVVDDSRYDQASMVRTIGLLLGVNPISLNDGLATPMFDIFTAQPVTAYNPPPVSTQLISSDQQLYQELLNEINGGTQ